MPLLYLAQRDGNFVTKQDMQEIGELLEITPPKSPRSSVSIVFITTSHPANTGCRFAQTLPCAMRGAEEFLHKLCENLGIRVGETTSDGLVTVEEVMCLAGCDRAPMFQVQDGNGLDLSRKSDS